MIEILSNVSDCCVVRILFYEYWWRLVLFIVVGVYCGTWGKGCNSLDYFFIQNVRDSVIRGSFKFLYKMLLFLKTALQYCLRCSMSLRYLSQCSWILS